MQQQAVHKPVHGVQLRQGLLVRDGLKEVPELRLELRGKVWGEQLAEGGVGLGVVDVGQGEEGEEGRICSHGPSPGVQKVFEGCHGMCQA